jgi:hypothetical protein
MDFFRSRRLATALAVTALASLVAAGPARACFDVDTTPSPWIYFTSATTAEVALTGATVPSLGLSIGQYCAAGLGHSNALITGITALAIEDDPDPAGSPLPIAGFAFATNATTTSDLGTASPGQTWQGFHTQVTSAVPGLTSVVLRFSITVPGGTTYTQIIDELQDFSFLGVDDANAAGNLLNTNQNFEGIAGAADLPECYDDVIQPGEICDGASDMGCIGTSCVDCSACVPTGQAEDCKSQLIKASGTNAKKQINCYAKAAKQSMSPLPTCTPPIEQFLDLIVNQKFIPFCPQAIPPSTTVTGWITTLNNNLAGIITPLGVVGPQTKCASKKFKAASFRAVAKAKCYAKAYATLQVVNPACLATADSKFMTKYTAAENLGCDPGNVGNAAAIGAAVDQYVITDLVGGVPPP